MRCACLALDMRARQHLGRAGERRLGAHTNASWMRGVDTELVTIVTRCLESYRNCTDYYPSEDFWTIVAPKELAQQRLEVATETNPLADFIQNGDSNYQILFKESTPVQMRICHKSVKQDFHIFVEDLTHCAGQDLS